MTIDEIVNYNRLPKYSNAHNCSDIQKAYIVIQQTKNDIVKELYKDVIVWFNKLAIKEYKSYNEYIIKNRKEVQ